MPVVCFIFENRKGKVQLNPEEIPGRNWFVEKSCQSDTRVGSFCQPLERKMSFLLQKIINQTSTLILDLLSHIQDKAFAGKNYSNLGEQAVINDYLKKLDINKGYCVDIAASDGISISNTYTLYKSGWHGLAVEFDPKLFSSLSINYSKFADVRLAKCKVTPLNVVALLEANSAPDNFEFLNLDIDGYDFFVLEKILSRYRPKLICTEINEKIPPPVKFTVKWDDNYVWASDHFYGQSISQLDMLLKAHNYNLVELHYNNAFLIPSEICSQPSLTPDEAFRQGYLNKPDRKQKFPWNKDMEDVLLLDPAKKLEFINICFQKYTGRFEASI